MRGQKEQDCLNYVKKFVFTINGKYCCNPFTGKNYSEVTDEEFKQEQFYYVNPDYNKSCFGLLKEDRIDFEMILRNAKPNDKPNEFPDFIFPNGFIEHFQISSSKANRKGAEHIKKMNLFKAKVNRETEEIMRKWNETPCFDHVRSKSWAMINPEHNYNFLMQSFVDNWKKHLESLNKYNGSKEVGIFMIEYSDIALNMCECIYADLIDGMSHGDMRKPEILNCYRLTRDKQLLEYVYQFKERIKYVIFVYYKGFEIIKVENIPYLLKLIPWNYSIRPIQSITSSSIKSISIPVQLKEKEESDTE